MSRKTGSISDNFGVIEPYDDWSILTKNTGLIAAIEIDGRDPDGLNALDHAALSAISQRIYGKLNRDISITEYFTHYEGIKISIKERINPISNALSKSREEYLNSKNLSGSRVVHYLEVEPSENINKLNIIGKVKHASAALFDSRSREILRNSISFENTFLIEKEELARLRAILQDAVDEVIAKWGGLFGARQLNLQEMWAHMRFLASMDASALVNGLNEQVPDEDLDIYLSPGDIENVIADEMDVLKISGATNQYVKMAAVRRFSNQRGKMIPGLWAVNDKAPVRLKGNYLIMTRWKPLSEFQKDYLFQRKHTDLERATLNFSSMMTGGEKRSVLEKQASMKGYIKVKMEELDAAESVADIWGIGHSFICIFGKNTKKIKETTLALNAAISNAKVNLTWESVSIEDAFKTIQPGQRHASIRDQFLTSSQFAAASLIYKSAIGQEIVPDLNDEATYIFESRSGEPFHYSSLIGGRSLVIGIGPIRSGKTYLKNTIATNFQKYGGLYRAIDIDPGSETVAQLFNGGIFRVSNDTDNGLNFFASYKGIDADGNDDTAFKIHALTMMQSFLKANDAKEYQTISPDEQRQLDKALDSTLALPPELRSLSSLVHHMPQALRVKFSRWVRKEEGSTSSNSGWYAHLFDRDVDAIGDLRKPIGVFNLQALKASTALLTPVQLEILYRVTQSFEDPELRHKPKLLDLDECHYPLSIPGFAEYIVSKIRTWGKWFGSIQMWTQSPEELLKTDGWSAICGAATTFIFMADQNMNVNVYKETFPFLTDAEIEAIKNLTRQKQAYIIQPELGISKVIVIDTEITQYVINTSHPREASIRDKLIAQHGFEEGLKMAIEEISKSKKSNFSVEDEITTSRLTVS